MNARRILIITNRVPHPLQDGGALAMDAMIRGYHALGFKVWVLAMNTTRHFVQEAALSGLYRYIAGFEAVPFDNDLRPARLAGNLLFSREPEHAERFYSKAFQERINDTIRMFGPDIIQLESLFLSAYLPAIRRITRARLVLRMHNIEHEVWSRLAAESTGLKAAYLRILARRMQRFEARIWREYDLLLAITDTDAAVVRRLDPALPVVTVPFGIDLGGGGRVLPAGFDQCYHVGAMDWLPNAAAVDWLLQDIWPRIRALLPGACFHFAGRHMPDRFFHQLPAGAYCHGAVPDMAAFLADKQVLLVPLRSGGGIRVKILEAMAAGKLVISTNTGMQGIAALPGVHYLQANTPEEFAAALQWCNDHPDAAKEMITAARELVGSRYDLHQIMQQLLPYL